MKYINKNTGRVIDWDESNGILIKSVWAKYTEKPKQEEKESVEDSVDSNEEEVQTFKSVKELEEKADKKKLAKTKAGNSYSFKNDKWEKVNE